MRRLDRACCCTCAKGASWRAHQGLYYWPGGERAGRTRGYQAGLVGGARVDPAAGRMILTMRGNPALLRWSPRPPKEPAPYQEVFAIGPELERERVEALWPTTPVAPSEPKEAPIEEPRQTS